MFSKTKSRLLNAAVESLERRSLLSVSFAPTTLYPGGSPTGTAVATVTFHERQDIITANTNGTISVFLRNDDGSFTAAQTVLDGLPAEQSFGGLPLSFNPASVIATAFNGNSDGNVDLVIFNGTNQVSLLNITGEEGSNIDFVSQSKTILNGLPITTSTLHTSAFVTAGTPKILTFANDVEGAVVADFNGDGKPDLAFLYNNATVGVMLGNGDGTFKAAQTFAVGSNAVDLIAADVTGDGKIDLLTANNNEYGSVSLLTGNGDGTFAPAQTLAAGNYATTIVAADVKGDGTLDIVTAGRPPAIDSIRNNETTICVLLNSGGGVFAPANTFAAEQGIVSGNLVATDLNGDGKIDLLVNGIVPGPQVVISGNIGVTSVGTISVLLGNGDGSFQAPQAIANISANTLAVADLNADGKPDIIATSASSQLPDQVNVLLNTSPIPSIYYNNTIITVTGTSAADTVNLSTANNQLIIDIDGLTKSFALSSVESILVNTYAGDDSVNIGTNVPNVYCHAGAGNDTLIAAPQTGSEISSNYGRDSLVGGAGNDSIQSNSAADATNTVVGGTGQDTLVGGLGGDLLDGSSGSHDSLNGAAGGNLVLIGGKNADTIVGATGSIGSDTIFTNRGGDSLTPGARDAVFRSPPPTATILNSDYIIDGTPGNDTITVLPSHLPTGLLLGYAIVVDGVTFDFSYDYATANNKFLNLQSVILRGDAGNDSIAIDYGATNILANGGGGNDTIIAYPILQSDAPSVDFSADSISVTISGIPTIGLTVNEGSTTGLTLNGGLGDDSLSAGSGDNLLIGDTGNDTLVGTAPTSKGMDTLLGGAGNDSIVYGTNDVLSGGGGSDSTAHT